MTLTKEMCPCFLLITLFHEENYLPVILIALLYNYPSIKLPISESLRPFPGYAVLPKKCFFAPYCFFFSFLHTNLTQKLLCSVKDIKLGSMPSEKMLLVAVVSYVKSA